MQHYATYVSNVSCLMITYVSTFNLYHKGIPRRVLPWTAVIPCYTHRCEPTRLIPKRSMVVYTVLYIYIYLFEVEKNTQDSVI